MAISFGSESKKPYIGSKEVKEAYVGSQLVYEGTPPVVYAFLGGTSDYAIAPWCELTKGAAIIKESGNYRVALSDSPTGRGYITLTKVYHKYLKFIAKRTPSAQVRADVIFYKNDVAVSTVPFFGYESSYQLYAMAIPDGCDKIEIMSDDTPNSAALVTNYVDAIRYEQS